MPTYIIERDKGAQQLLLSDWLNHIQQSKTLKLYPSRKGINPFTKEPVEFHPAPGSAFFETPNGGCSIRFENGKLIMIAEDADGLPQINDIAHAFGATVRPDDSGDEG